MLGGELGGLLLKVEYTISGLASWLVTVQGLPLLVVPELLEVPEAVMRMGAQEGKRKAPLLSEWGW